MLVYSKKIETKDRLMLTLADIDNMFPLTHDGSVYSDLHKDAYGFRPRGELATFEDIAAFQKAWDIACKALEREQERESQRQAEAIKNFEEEIANNLQYGASSREVAIRWICDAYRVEDAPGQDGYEHLEYLLNLPYGYIDGI